MEEYFNFLVKSKVTPNGAFTLYCVNKRIGYPNFINTGVELKRLSLDGYLRETPNGMSINYEITDKGKLLLLQLEEMILRTKKMKKMKVPLSEWKDDIETFRKMFPAGFQSSARIQSSAKDLLDRFVWFFAEYPEYDWDNVLDATEAYLDHMEKQPQGMKFVMIAKNFVKKEERSGKVTVTSPLADWCDAVVSGTVTQLDTGTHYFGQDVV